MDMFGADVHSNSIFLHFHSCSNQHIKLNSKRKENEKISKKKLKQRQRYKVHVISSCIRFRVVKYYDCKWCCSDLMQAKEQIKKRTHSIVVKLMQS